MIPVMGESYTFFFQKHSHKGRTQVVPCTMSFLGPQHAEQSIDLHNRIVNSLGNDIFIPTDEEETKRYHQTDQGFAVGIWHEDKLICVRTTKTDGDWVNEGLEHMEMPADPTHTTALTGYAVVDKEFRGNNVQLLSYYASEYLLSKNKKRILSSVAPRNVFSLENILRSGYYIIALKSLYGGYLRYITEKKLFESQPIWKNWHHTVNLRNFEEQKQLIDCGCVGYKLIRKAFGGFSILYAPMCDEQPKDQAHVHKPVVRSM